MTNPLSFDDLQGILHQHIAQLPDHRKKGPQYPIPYPRCRSRRLWHLLYPIAIIFGLPAPLQQTKGHNNAHTLLGVEQIPCDNQIRNAARSDRPEPSRSGVS